MGSFMALLNSFQMKAKTQKPSSSGAILLRRFGAKYLKAVTSPILGSIVARKN
jgi:protoporphyrinogen oxidase